MTHDPSRELAELAEALLDDHEATPADASFHWYSVVQARGWEQPRLDGGNGGWAAESFCAPDLVRNMDRENRELQQRRLRREIPGAGAGLGRPAPRR